MPVDSSLIFDVGLHIGQDSEFYLTKGFRVVAVEALTELCDKATSRLNEHVDSRMLTIENVAIAEETGPVTFYVSPISVWGTTRREWSERGSLFGMETLRAITVPGVRFQELLKKHGIPYYLKVDIEGADLLCLRALAEFDDKPKLVSIESSKTSWKDLLEEFDLLEDLGYRRFKVVPQHKVFKQSGPSPSREGYATTWQFSEGASGLFGEDAPGRWLTRREALIKYFGIFIRYTLVGDAGVLTENSRVRMPRTLRRALAGVVLLLAGRPGWYDTHARLE